MIFKPTFVSRTVVDRCGVWWCKQVKCQHYVLSLFLSFVMVEKKKQPLESTAISQCLQGWWFSQMLKWLPFLLYYELITKKLHHCIFFYETPQTYLYFRKKNPLINLYALYSRKLYTTLMTKVGCALSCFETVLWGPRQNCNAEHLWHRSCLRLLWLSTQLHNSLLSLNMISEPSRDTMAAIECVWAITTVYFTLH